MVRSTGIVSRMAIPGKRDFDSGPSDRQKRTTGSICAKRVYSRIPRGMPYRTRPNFQRGMTEHNPITPQWSPCSLRFGSLTAITLRHRLRATPEVKPFAEVFPSGAASASAAAPGQLSSGDPKQSSFEEVALSERQDRFAGSVL